MKEDADKKAAEAAGPLSAAGECRRLSRLGLFIELLQTKPRLKRRLLKLMIQKLERM